MTAILVRFTNAVRFIASRGAVAFTREIAHRLSQEYYEFRFGIKTGRIARMRDLGITNLESIDYHPVDYRALLGALRGLDIDFATSTFLDYGVGRGRAVVVAASKPFRRIVGIELSPQLLAEALVNVQRARGVRCRNIELLEADATTFVIPDDVNVLHFYNPFRGHTLEAVINNMHASFRRAPRTMYIVFFNKGLFEEMIRGKTWVERVQAWSAYPDLSCGVYRTVPPPSGR